MLAFHWKVNRWNQDALPEAAGPRSYEGGGPAVLVRHAVGAAEVLEEEVQLVLSGLVGKLVETLLGGRGGLQTQRDPWIHLSFLIHRIETLDLNYLCFLQKASSPSGHTL